MGPLAMTLAGKISGAVPQTVRTDLEVTKSFLYFTDFLLPLFLLYDIKVETIIIDLTGL